MKAKLNLNSNLTFRALELQARKAVAISTLAAKNRPEERKSRKRVKREIPSIDRDIKMIHGVIASRMDENHVAILENPAKGMECRGKISIFDKSKPKSPELVYAFYADIPDNQKLGSVAIYGDDADARCKIIRLRGSLFGYSVASVTVEVGRRPFVDVKLKK